MDELKDWGRKYYQAGGDPALVSYIIFGHFEQPLEISMSSYRTAGVPDFIDVHFHERDEEPELLESFLDGYIGDWLKANDQALHATCKMAAAAIEIRGVLREPMNLNYLRDVIGIITALSDKRGVGVLDCLALRCYRPDEWKTIVWEPGVLHTSAMINTLVTKDPGGPGWWVSTRGMRKFGRPDVSVRGVPRPDTDTVVDFCNRLASMMAQGAIVPSGKIIKAPTIEGDLVCKLAGGPEDTTYHNQVIEIDFPRQQTIRKTGPIRRVAAS
ncbi:MAG TPA: hypothetical protein VGK19_04115 [Capsulimonadaceae bacterium]|jgi:hypothetical protein